MDHFVLTPNFLFIFVNGIIRDNMAIMTDTVKIKYGSIFIWSLPLMIMCLFQLNICNSSCSLFLQFLVFRIDSHLGNKKSYI